MLADEIRELFRPPPGGLLLIITVGNDLRSDDGVGPHIAREARPASPRVMVLDAGERPEDILEAAVALKPARTLVVDAADFGGEPGEVKLIPPEAVPEHTLSTHSFPLPVVARLLAEDTGTEVRFLGIQAASVALGGGLSPRVREAAAEIVRLIDGE